MTARVRGRHGAESGRLEFLRHHPSWAKLVEVGWTLGKPLVMRMNLNGGFEFVPVGIVVLVSGFWTGNLQLSDPADGPDLHPVRDQQVKMTRYWFVWLGAAAVLFALGWIPLIVDDPNDSGDLSFGGWATWVLAWFAAIIAGSIGVILAGLRLAVRHRTRLT